MAEGQEQQPFNLVNLKKDVLLDILHRLELTWKDVARWKLVCKQWEVFFSTRDFARSFNLIMPNANSLYMNKDPSNHRFATGYLTDNGIIGPNEIEVGFRIDAMQQPCYVWGSCDGLICMTANANKMIIWNPVTGQHKQFAVADESDGSYCLYGFGRSFAEEDFKMVKIPFHTNGDSVYSPVKVATIKTTATLTWRTASSVSLEITGKGKQVLVNGSLHWLGRRPDNEGTEAIILRFNLELEVCDVIPLPGNQESKISYLLNFKDHLACMAAPSESYEIDIWVLKRYGTDEGRWVKQYRYPQLPPLCRFVDHVKHHIEPVSLSADGWLLVKITPYDAEPGGSYFRELDTRTYLEYHLEQLEERRWREFPENSHMRIETKT